MIGQNAFNRLPPYWSLAFSLWLQMPAVLFSVSILQFESIAHFFVSKIHFFRRFLLLLLLLSCFCSSVVSPQITRPLRMYPKTVNRCLTYAAHATMEEQTEWAQNTLAHAFRIQREIWVKSVVSALACKQQISHSTHISMCGGVQNAIVANSLFTLRYFAFRPPSPDCLRRKHLIKKLIFSHVFRSGPVQYP